MMGICLMGFARAQTVTHPEEDLNIGAPVKVMIVPYNPSRQDLNIEEYLNEKYPGQKVPEIKKWLSFGLDKNISTRIINSENNVKFVINDNAREEGEDIGKIHGAIEYRYEKRDKQSIKIHKKLLDKFFGGDGKEISVNYYQSDKNHKYYYNANLTDPGLFTEISEKYGINLFVFINQVEINTYYKKPVDAKRKIYLRQIKVHFSVYDAEAFQLYGDIATINFSDVLVDIDEVIIKSFPVVANYNALAY